MPLKFQRYTKHLLATGKLFGHIENDQGILFSKRMGKKDAVLGEIFREQVFSDFGLLIDYKTHWETTKLKMRIPGNKFFRK